MDNIKEYFLNYLKGYNKTWVDKDLEKLKKYYDMDSNRLIYYDNHKNNDIIAMSIIAKGGEFLENAIGEGTLVAEVMLKGTKKYSSQELAQLMEENGINKPSIQFIYESEFICKQ